jgi:hypothetical protein
MCVKPMNIFLISALYHTMRKTEDSIFEMIVEKKEIYFSLIKNILCNKMKFSLSKRDQ